MRTVELRASPSTSERIFYKPAEGHRTSYRRPLPRISYRPLMQTEILYNSINFYQNVYM
jgi:hypothetical protein